MYSVFILSHHPIPTARTYQNISLLPVSAIYHWHRFRLQPLKCLKIYPFCSLYCFVFLVPLIFTCVKAKAGTQMKNSSLWLMILNTQLWSGWLVGLSYCLWGFFVCFPKEEQKREWKTSNLLPSANYHCLCFMRNILNIPHLEQKDRLQSASSTCWWQNLKWFWLLYFFFPTSQPDNLPFFFFFCFHVGTISKKKIAYHSSSWFPMTEYVAKSPISLLLYYTSFPKGIINIPNNTSTVHVYATEASPSRAFTWHISQLLLCCIQGHILQLVLHRIPCHV